MCTLCVLRDQNKLCLRHNHRFHKGHKETQSSQEKSPGLYALIKTSGFTRLNAIPSIKTNLIRVLRAPFVFSVTNSNRAFGTILGFTKGTRKTQSSQEKFQQGFMIL